MREFDPKDVRITIGGVEINPAGYEEIKMYQQKETVEMVRDILANFTYKPWWIFSLQETNGDWWVHISWRPRNSRNPGERCDVASTWIVPHSVTVFPREFLIKSLRSKIHALEMHEADEWLVFDGERKFDPHSDPEIQVDNESI